MSLFLFLKLSTGAYCFLFFIFYNYNMKFFSNKFFILFLCFTVIVYFAWAEPAHAFSWDDVFDFFEDVFETVTNIIDTVFNVIFNLVIGISEVTLGNVLGVSWLSADGSCRLGNLSGRVLKTYAGECGGDSGGGGSTVAGSPTLQSQTATPIVQNSCTTGFILNYETIDALKYGIYRDGNLISQGFLGEERTTRCWADEWGGYDSGCFVVVGEPILDEYGQLQYVTKYGDDGSIISKKLLTNDFYQKTEYFNYPSPHTSNFSYTDANLAPNTTYKYDIILLDRNGTQYRYPELRGDTKCPPHIVFNGPNIIEYPNPITLSWIAENVTSLIASGDWSGSKEMGTYPYKSESLSKPRGTYTFILSGTGPSGSASKQVTVQVIKIPRCTFAADPTSIILPQTSVLSWSCSYADTCSINQGVGSVNPISGTQEVRPSATTTYTLACNSSDGERTWQSTVNVGFTPRVREVAP